MRIIRHQQDIPSQAKCGVLALGNFDGVHHGHQVILAATADLAARTGAPAAVMTFYPHPREYFNPTLPSLTLTPLKQKAQLIEALGIQFLVALHFNQALAHMTAEDFVKHWLVETLNVRHVVIGHDFIFGHNRGGNEALLRQLAPTHGYEMTTVDAVSMEGEVCSSSLIRRYLSEGNIEAANAMLGRSHSISGRIVRGDQRGRKLGYPTANVHLGRHYEFAHGVYAVRCEVDGRTVAGVANYGRRPTFDGSKISLEVYLFDFSDDIYGKPFTVSLLHRLREEIRFDGPDALKAQIARDVIEAKKKL